MSVEVVVNGEPRALPEEATIGAAVREAGVAEPARGVAVAVDGEVVPRGEWEDRTLENGQRVEVLHAVQGG